ncbi:MAG: flagellar basal body rod protein FlgB [Fuerstiella sp.]
MSDSTDMEIMGKQLDLLKQLTTAADMRQKVVSQNIANINTPGYKSQEVKFEDALVEQLSKKNGSVRSPASPEIAAVQNLTMRNDGNNVDLDREIGQMNKNALLMQTYLQLMGAEMKMMRQAIDGG